MSDNCQVLYENLEDKVEDHEERIRNLEKSNIEMRYEIMAIKQGQAELKALTLENHKQHTEQLNNFMNRMAEMIEETLKHDQKQEEIEQETEAKKKLTDRKELWGIGGAIIAWLLSQLSKLIS